MKQLSIVIAFLLISFSTQEILTREDGQSQEAITIQKLEQIYKSIKEANQVAIESEVSVTVTGKAAEQSAERDLAGNEAEQKKGNTEADGQEKAKSEQEKPTNKDEKDKKPEKKAEPPKKVVKMIGGILTSSINGSDFGNSSILSVISMIVLIFVTLLG